MVQINDCKLSYYLANGATTNDLQDAEREWLLAQGIAPEHNQDMFTVYLKSQGYTGSYSDMTTQFWIDNNCYE